MILFKMSPATLNSHTLDKIYDEIIDHMKRSGAFDEIRMSLIDPIWSGPSFEDILKKFEYECQKFCEEVDLNQTRNALRTKLASHFDRYSTSRHMVKAHISRLLKEREDELRKEYYKHAQAFLKKFLPPPTQDSQQDHPGVEDMDIESNKDDDEFEQIEDDEEVERPAYSPIGNESPPDNRLDDRPELSMSPVSDNLDDEQPPELKVEANQGNEEQAVKIENNLTEHKDSVDNKVEHLDSVPEENNFDQIMPSLEDIPQPPDEDSDELEKLTFSSVSSVNTAELSDFDNSIKLSDDEANIVGKPKNSKVSIEEVQGQINDLQTTNIECKQTVKIEPVEPTEASESDGCSENAHTGRRVTRTRKSNPRYNNEHYI